MESTSFDTEQSHADLQRRPPSAAVVRAVADAEDVEETELPPLFHAIDPDALDALFEKGPLAARSTGTVRFSYADHDILVTADGAVTVEPALGQ